MPEPGKPYKKVKYKAEKIKRQKLVREARRELKARKYHEVFGTPYTDTTKMTPEERTAYWAAQKEAKKAERRAARKAKREEEEARQDEHQKKKEEKQKVKLSRRKEKKEQRRRTAEAVAKLKAEEDAKYRIERAAKIAALVAETDAENAAKAKAVTNEVVTVKRESEPIPDYTITKTEIVSNRAIAVAKQEEPVPDQFAVGADEIKLGLNIDGKIRKIPGVGRVDRYPTKGEKKQKKLECQAYDAGMSVEEYKAKLAAEREAKEAPEREKLAKQRQERGGLKSGQWHNYIRLATQVSQEEAEGYFLRVKQRNEERKARKEALTDIAESSTEAVSNGAETLPIFPITNGTITTMNGTTDLSLNPYEPVLPQSKPISAKKMEKYEKKAAKKGISVHEYLQKKAEKKSSKSRAITSPEDESGPKNLSKIDAILAQARASVDGNGTTATSESNNATFVIDNDGDNDMTSTFMIDSKGDPDILSRPKPTLVWHPDMLGDRKVKELSKEERKARLEWMRERRRQRNIALGKNPLSKKERHKIRVQKKMKQRDRFVWEVLQEKGLAGDNVSKEELNNARRAAKRKQREIKREKRNKVIHRKKVGSNIAGVYGPAQISKLG
jgi:hypothetical protein